MRHPRRNLYHSIRPNRHGLTVEPEHPFAFQNVVDLGQNRMLVQQRNTAFFCPKWAPLDYHPVAIGAILLELLPQQGAERDAEVIRPQHDSQDALGKGQMEKADGE